MYDLPSKPTCISSVPTVDNRCSTLGVTPYVWTVNTTENLSCPWGRDPWGTGISVCEQFVFLPTALYALWLPVGAGLLTNLFD